MLLYLFFCDIYFSYSNFFEYVLKIFTAMIKVLQVFFNSAFCNRFTIVKENL